MANNDAVGSRDHGRDLEEDYFRRQDQELVERMRKQAAAEKTRRELGEKTGLTDPALLADLEGLGFTPDTVALLPVIPVVQTVPEPVSPVLPCVAVTVPVVYGATVETTVSTSRPNHGRASHTRRAPSFSQSAAWRGKSPAVVSMSSIALLSNFSWTNSSAPTFASGSTASAMKSWPKVTPDARPEMTDCTWKLLTSLMVFFS